MMPCAINAAQFDPLIVEATLQGVAIELVSGAAAQDLERVGGIGAYLYYTVGWRGAMCQ